MALVVRPPGACRLREPARWPEGSGRAVRVAYRRRPCGAVRRRPGESVDWLRPGCRRGVGRGAVSRYRRARAWTSSMRGLYHFLPVSHYETNLIPFFLNLRLIG